MSGPVYGPAGVRFIPNPEPPASRWGPDMDTATREAMAADVAAGVIGIRTLARKYHRSRPEVRAFLWEVAPDYMRARHWCPG